jgi:enamine deaminase RidA (YjgF/YER057c/UK114 family)
VLKASPGARGRPARYPNRRLGGDVVDASTCTTTLRRFTGPVGDELAVFCRPRSASTAFQQAQAAYRALAALLAGQHASFRYLACETLFLREIQRDLPLVLEARTQVLAESGPNACAPLPAFIQQAPVDQGASFELAASALLPRRRGAWSVRDVPAASPCACEGCVRSGARLVCTGDQMSLRTTNVHGTGGDAFTQVWDMFCAAERLLDDCGMEFRDVVRTWIYLRDIDRDYDAFNQARREFFRHRGIEQRPASTGVQGIPFPARHDFSMRLHAMRSRKPLEARPVSTPSLNEAWSYGVDFSRGLRLVEANKVTIHVSGTASIDQAGRTVHAGNFEAQVDRMLHNISSLLVRQGATFEDVISGVMYLRNASDAPVLRAMCHERGFDGFPCALVEARLCRPELLCEAEAVAMLPLDRLAPLE